MRLGSKVRMVPITHQAKPGKVGCERDVLCSDFREGESIAIGASRDVLLGIVTCLDCREVWCNLAWFGETK